MGKFFHGRRVTRQRKHAGELLLRRWAVGMVLLALAGIALSWVAARGTAHNHAQRSREAFRIAAARVDANMDMEVAHETDLLVTAAAFMQEHPGYHPGAFKQWAGDVRAVRRYPELITVAEMQPAARGHCPLVTFAGPRWILRLTALGAREICAGPDSLALTRDSGKQIDFGFGLGSMHFMGEEQPVYRTADVPPTVAARRRDFLGDVAIALYPEILLRHALSGSPDIGLQIRTRDDASLTFVAGPRNLRNSISDSLSNGLSERITGTVQGSSIFADTSAIAILGGGSAVSLLLALALFLLGTGRARAKRLVDEKTRELAFQALHDGLTGLPNRSLVMDRIGHALARSSRGTHPVALLFIDADGFKTVNDTFGHAAGDELLRTIGTRLSGLLRASDTVGRLGGDEFVVLLEPGEGDPSPESVAKRILEVLSQPIDLQSGVQVRLTASVGIAVGWRQSTEELLRDADLALYSAKHGGRNRYAIFEDTMQTAIADRHALEIDLKQALARDELFLVYQPTFTLQDRRVWGVEALLRWQHPNRGLVPPDVFIPIAEDSGLIREIGRWVAGEACAQAAAWRARGLPLTMAVNVSGRQLDEEDFSDKIRSILEQTGLDPEALTLEITESALMRSPHAAAVRLDELKRIGVRIAIDDFGTGYSSLAYLQAFPVDSLKIDRAFISGLGASRDADAFVTTLVQLGRTLRISTLAEGIEDETQLKRLIEARCDYGQGFLLARPLPAEQLEAMLDDGSLFAPHSSDGDAIASV